MQFKIFAVALLGSTALAQTTPDITAAPTGIESAIASLISVYIPSSDLIPLGSAVESAASAAGITGSLSDILSAALDATTPPVWITAIPSTYQSNLMALESAIISLKEGATGATSAASGSPIPSSGKNTTIASSTSGAPKSPTAAATSASSSGAAMPAAIVPGAAGILGLLGVAFAL